jgi:Cysteine-rich CWC
MNSQINPATCPICGEPNQCAMEIAKSTGNPVEECWCASVVFTAETLAKVHVEALNKACICKKCASEDL